MRLIKIEKLCKICLSSWNYADQLIPIGKYKLFYDDNSSHIQDYLLQKDVKETKSIVNVTEFSNK